MQQVVTPCYLLVLLLADSDDGSDDAVRCVNIVITRVLTRQLGAWVWVLEPQPRSEAHNIQPGL